jgi:hypothetical protein
LLLAVALVTRASRASGGLETRRIVGGPLVAAIAAALVMAALRANAALALAAGASAYVAVLVAWERRFYPEDARALGDFLLRRG